LFELLEGATPYRREDAERYVRRGWWTGLTLGDLLDRSAGVHPDKEAFVDRETRLTYAQARDLTDRLALAFLELGIKPLDRVLMQLPNWNEFVPAYFGLQRIGAIPVMLIDRYRQQEVGRLAHISQATSWIVPIRYGKVDYTPIIRDVLAASPQLQRVITVRGEAADDGFPCLENLMAQTEPTAAALARLAELGPDAMQVCHMGPTGGTTGMPKVVCRTHNSLGACVGFCSLAWEQHCEDINLIVGSIGHDLNFTKGFLGSLITMGTVVMLDTTDMQVVCETIQREKVTSIIWVPTLAQRLLQYERLGDYDLSSVRKMHCGGGVAVASLVREVFARLGVRFCNGYGATEGMTTITRPIDDVETVCSTVGRPTCPADTYKVIDQMGATLPPDTSGELLVKGPSVFTGYYRNDEENARVFEPDGFFHTGDVAKISPKGYVTITGRIKEMINRGGESISATQIEDLIDRHPAVAIVAVVAMPDPVMGERVCAYVQVTTGASVTFEEIIAFLRAEKASVLALPERIEFVEAMPYTPAQKVDKNALREDIRRRLASETQTDGTVGDGSGDESAARQRHRKDPEHGR
jgi:non-ribosomal peptide synthetase component E (peptide arylation enzyme)